MKLIRVGQNVTCSRQPICVSAIHSVPKPTTATMLSAVRTRMSALPRSAWR